MLRFVTSTNGIELIYHADQQGNRWVWDELNTKGRVVLNRIFTFERSDLVAEPEEADEQSDLENFRYRFNFGARRNAYFHIEGRLLGIKNPIFINESDLPLKLKVFVAERNISVFGKIADLIEPGKPIVVGGNRADAIPLADFQLLLSLFPNSTELTRYSAARITNIVGDYLEPMKDARAQYEAYLNRRRSTLHDAKLPQSELLKTETDKYLLIRNTITGWLTHGATRSESDWQKMIVNFILLLFPKYVAVLSNVRIADAYSDPGNTIDRFIDTALVDAAGNIDVIEIKKPFDDSLMRRTPYRDNYIPAKELSGSIMQAEKYLFHLSKWGLAGEKALTKKYATELPPNLDVRITNPKAMIILGRDRNTDGTPALNSKQQLDLEIIKRKYANIIDILTYDDLLRRLENIIASLQKRASSHGSSDFRNVT